jgi:ribosomal protein S18 acetylase RimI-like enzyme
MIDHITVDRGVPDDLTALLQLNVWLTSQARQEQIIRESINGRTCFVARTSAGQPVGVITWNRTFFNRPFVWLLVVSPAHRRLRIGSKLLEAVEGVCGDDIFVSTEHVNTAMQQLLERSGYTKCGELDHINPRGNPEIFYYKRLNGRDEMSAFPVDR